MSTREGLRRTTRGVKREASPDVVESPIEPARKRRAIDRKSSTAKVKDDAPTLPLPPPTPVQEKPTTFLPVKIANDQPIPVLNKPQSARLSNKTYQTIAESGVLALSLERSRHAWMHNAIFERFWSKAHYKRKKDVEAEGVKTPSGSSQPATPGATFGHQKSGGAKPPMTKVGECKLIVDPHMFDITIYIVKDPNPPAQPQSQSQPSPGVYTKGIANQNFMQYSNGAYRPASPAPKTPAASTPPVRIQTYHPSSALPKPGQPGSSQPAIGGTSQAATKPNSAAFSTPKAGGTHPGSQGQAHPTSGPNTSTKPPYSAPQTQKQTPYASTASTPGASTPKSTVPAVKSESKPKSTSTEASSSTQSKPDPVIAILAERAQLNSHLKDVMQIVATGKASPEQLAYFQGHITNITAIVERRKREEELRKAKEQEARNVAAAQTKPTGSWTSTPKPQTTTPGVVSQSKTTNSSPNTASPATIATPSTKPKSALPPNTQAARSHASSPLGLGSSTPSVSTQQSRIGQGQLTPSQQMAPTPRYVSTPVAPVRKPIIAPLHVLIEFNQNSIDRFLFPAYSILQISPDWKSCLCSFLVVRPGSRAADPSRYPQLDHMLKEKSSTVKATGKNKETKSAAGKSDIKETEYYQPVTVTFSCDDVNIMHYLSRVVKPKDEVLKYMKDVMRRAKRAEDAYLPRRLPRKKVGLGEDGLIAVAA